MGKKILIVDDNKSFCEIVNEYVKNMGQFDSAIFATDGNMALNKVQNQKFDLILLDINLPRYSGIDILSEIHNDKRSFNRLTPIIVMSGEIEPRKIKEIKNLGCSIVLLKPFSEVQFQEEVIKAFTLKSA